MIISALGSFLLFGFLDLVFRSWNGPPPQRWLVLHLIGNLLIAGLTAQNALLGFVDPMNAMIPIDENLPFFLMISMHLYHLVFYETSHDDRFHHIVFGLGAMGLVWNWGRIAHTLMFLMYGLPGAIDYFLLLWYPEKEVVLNRNITLYIRSPLASAALYIVYLNLWTSQVPSVVLIVSMVLMIYNTQYHTMNTVLAK